MIELLHDSYDKHNTAMYISLGAMYIVLSPAGGSERSPRLSQPRQPQGRAGRVPLGDGKPEERSKLRF